MKIFLIEFKVFFHNFIYEVFRGTKRHTSIELIELSKKYGPVFTFWMGPIPFIMIFDRDIARETFRRNEFAGRPDSYFGKNSNFFLNSMNEMNKKIEILYL